MADTEFKTPVLIGPIRKKAPTAVAAAPADSIEKSEKVAIDDKESVPLKEQPKKKPELIPGAREISPSDREKYEKIIRDLKYHEPLGSAPADSRYSLEVLKAGTILDNITFQTKSYFIVGRVPGCDILAEHPTVSRLHAIFQFIDGNAAKVEDGGSHDGSNEEEQETQVRDRGLYVYDLGSTHGTFLNKNRLIPNRFYRLRVGHVVKFGNSSRLYIVSGPSDDEEQESEKTVTELLKERTEKELERKRLGQEMEQKTDVEGRNVEEEGITWGMAEDAEEETDLNENPFSMEFDTSDLTLDNPKKTLRGWFEREGYDLEYDVREKAAGHFICRIELPLDRPDGGKVFAEVDLKGKKKEVVHQCALQACQILDKYGVLRQSHHESRLKKKTRDWEEQDYYSSDEDTFLDRTGSVEKKREKRMVVAGKIQPKVETYESLLEKSNSLAKEIDAIKEKIAKTERASADEDEVDPLDAYMSDLKTGAADVKKLKAKLRELTAEQQHNKKLLDVARPTTASLPPIRKVAALESEKSSDKLSEKQPESNAEDSKQKKPTAIIGPRVHFKGPRKPVPQPTKEEPKLEDDSKMAEEEEENENEDKTAPAQLSEQEVIPSRQVLPDRPKDVHIVKDVGSIDSNQSGTLSPAEPRPAVNVGEPEDEEEEESIDEVVERDSGSSAPEKPKSRKRVRHRKTGITKEVKYDYDADDPKYSTWLPPTNQKGDGKTALNEKLGY